jgi:hypothetical protein
MKIKTESDNSKNMKIVIDEWNLGPNKTSVEKDANKEYWSKMAKVWKISEVEARSKLCANCEYFNNTNDMMLQMNSIPLNTLDIDGGGRGYCHKFDFICHNLRTCQAWEEKDFRLKDIESGFDAMFINPRKG